MTEEEKTERMKARIEELEEQNRGLRMLCVGAAGTLGRALEGDLSSAKDMQSILRSAALGGES